MAKANKNSSSRKGRKKSSSSPEEFFGKKRNPRLQEKKVKQVKEKVIRKSRPAQKPKRQDSDRSDYRLNQFISRSGVCSRREADKLIAAGKVKVNGKIVKEMSVRINPDKDKVIYGGKVLTMKRFVYLLMNKPKNHITSVKDEKGRKTVMEIVEQYTQNRVFPVGRLDRNTTGLLLFTNDGDLAKKLSHPSGNVKKVYHLKLSEAFSEQDMQKLQGGIELEDGPIQPDAVDYIEGTGKKEVGIEIHSGKNRIVRRIFESMGYEVKSLDRVMMGPITKKNLPRGKCRFLSEKEAGFLKMM